jgi:hypothetical protein
MSELIFANPESKERLIGLALDGLVSPIPDGLIGQHWMNS